MWSKREGGSKEVGRGRESKKGEYVGRGGRGKGQGEDTLWRGREGVWEVNRVKRKRREGDGAGKGRARERSQGNDSKVKGHSSH